MLSAAPFQSAPRLLACLALPMVLAGAHTALALPQINEIRTDQPFNNDDEYFELVGFPGETLNGLTYLVIGDGAANSGEIEAIIDLNGQNISPSGLFLVVENNPLPNLGALGDFQAPLNFENQDNVTHMLVDGFTGNLGDDLDTNDDCVFDVTPWTGVVDLVAIVQEPNPPVTTECHYGPPEVGPDGLNAPGHVYRDGNTFQWQVGQFDPPGGQDTPGQPNAVGLLSREQAINIFLTTQSPVDPDTATTAAYMYLLSSPTDSTLMPGDVVADYDSSFTLNIANPTYMFWVDYQTDRFWEHRAGFVFVDATNGTPVTFDSFSWPSINGPEYFTFVEENELSPDLLYGNGFVIGFNEPLINPVGQTITNKWAIIVAGKDLVRPPKANPDEQDIRGDVAAGYEYLNGVATGPKIDSTHIQVLGLDMAPGQGTGATKKEIEAAVCSLAAGPQCDKLYFYYYGHGSEGIVSGQQRGGGIKIAWENGTKRNFSYKDLMDLVKKANAKEVCVLIMDCYSGKAIASFKSSGMKGTIVTSADANTPTQRRGNGSPFMHAILKCAKDPNGDLNGDGDVPIPEALTWARAVNDSVNKINPQARVFSDRKRDSYSPPKCKTRNERKLLEGKRDRKYATRCLTGDAQKVAPIGGGTISYHDTTKSKTELQTNGAGLIYEIKEMSYADKIIGDNGIKDEPGSKVTKSWFYIQNPWPQNVPPFRPGGVQSKYKVKVECVGTNHAWEIWPWIAAEKRYCLFQLPEGCKKLKLTRGDEVNKAVGCPFKKVIPPSSGGVWNLSNSVLLDSTAAGGITVPYTPGDYILVDELVTGAPGDSFVCSVIPVPGWDLAVSSSAFTMPATHDTATVFLTGTVPDTATVGAYLDLRVINLTTPDTLDVGYHAMILDSLTTPLAAGAQLQHQFAQSVLGLTASAGTVDLDNTVFHALANSSVTVDPTGTLLATFSSVFVDSGVVCPVTVNGTALWDNVSISNAANGLVLNGASGSIHGGGSVRSQGDGLTLTGDLSGLDMEFFVSDESAGDGLVIDGVTGFTLPGAFIDLSGGVDVRAINSSALELRDSSFDDDSVSVDVTSVVSRTWTTWFQVVAANGDSLLGVDITVVNALGDTVLTDVTDSLGFVNNAVLVDWINTGGTAVDHSPHVIHAELGGVDTTFAYDAVFSSGVVVALTGIPSVTGVDPPVKPQLQLQLAQNSPNPFLSRTTFRFALPAAGTVSLKLYDARGRLVSVLIDEPMTTGEYEIPWQANSNLANGIYFYRLATPSGVRTKKLTLLR